MAKVTVKKEQNFTVISNDIFKDTRISFKAKGLLTTMLSCPPDWNYTIEGLSKISKDGKASIRTALAELEECGYLERKQLRNEKGAFVDLEYIVYENPKTDLPMSENRKTGNPISENRTQLNTNISSTNELNTDLLKTDGLNTEKGDTLSFDNGMAETHILEKCEDKAPRKKSRFELLKLEADMQKRFADIAEEQNISETAKQTLINGFSRYLIRYMEKTRKVHPILTNGTLNKIIQTFISLEDIGHNRSVDLGIVDEYGESYLDEMIDEYFSINHSLKGDWHISGFANREYLEKFAQHIVEY